MGFSPPTAWYLLGTNSLKSYRGRKELLDKTEKESVQGTAATSRPKRNTEDLVCDGDLGQAESISTLLPSLPLSLPDSWKPSLDSVTVSSGIIEKGLC